MSKVKMKLEKESKKLTDLTQRRTEASTEINRKKIEAKETK
jgi:hypothetical protein